MTTATAPTLIANRYRLEEKLGQGGMGAVYRVWDRLSGQPIALKQVLIHASALQFSSLGDSSEYVLALAREFQTLASLRHPHIISVLDYGFDGNQQPYFTMSLLENARTIREAAAPLDSTGKINLILQMLQALAYLHRRGILHRDLKPANVMVDTNGNVKVLDFGLAVEPEQAVGTVGTLAYMAPEVIKEEGATQASDLYAVGLIAYELLTGEYPFDTSTLPQLMQDILGKPIDFSRLPETDVPIISPATAEDTPTTAGSLEFPSADQPTMIGKIEISTESQITMPGDVLTPISRPALPLLPLPSVEPLAADQPLTLRFVIRKLLERNQEHRYQTAEAVIHDLCMAVGLPIPAESHVIRESFLQAAKFVGRETELQQLIGSLEQAVARQSSAFLIAGESGVGKSRLLDELRTRALVKGAQVIRGQAVNEGGVPYQLWRDPARALCISTTLSDFEAGVLKDLVPDISSLLERTIPDAPALEGAARQQRLILTLIDVFKRQSQPIVLLMEDLQWAGESLTVLQFLLRNMADLPLMIVGNYRQDEAPDLPKDLPDAKVIPLARLNEQEISTLSHSMLGTMGRHTDLVSLLHRETEGNVFFLVEVMRVLAEDAGRLSDIGSMPLPERVFAGGVWAILERRLGRIPPAYHIPLNIAAAIGRQIDLRLLNAVDPAFDWENWLITCGNAAVLEVQDNRWRFAHDKLREHLLSGLSDEQRPGIYRQIAVAMEEVYPDDAARDGALAYYWGVAGDLKKEALYSDYAGEVAYTISDNYAAERYYQRAAELKDQLEERRLPHMYIKFGDTLTRLGNYPESMRYLHLARTLARDLKDESLEAQSLLHQAINRNKQGENSREIYEKVIEIARRTENKLILADALGWLSANVSIHEFDYAKAYQFAVDAVEISRALDTSAIQVRALSAAALAAHYMDNPADSDKYFQEGLALAKSIGDRHEMGVLLSNRAGFLQQKGQYSEAYALQLETLPLIRDTGAHSSLLIILMNLTNSACQLEKLEEADLYLIEAAALATDLSAFYQTGILLNKAEILRQLESWEDGAMLAACVREAMPPAAPELAEIDQMLRDFQANLPSLTYASAVKRGKALSLDEALDMIREGEI